MSAEKPSSHVSRVGDLFDEKAGTWGDKYAEGGALRARLDRFKAVLASRVDGRGRVLDFGCGAGDLANHLASAGYALTGVDISESMLAAARERFGDRADWIRLDEHWRRLPFGDGTFSAAVASSAVEYVPEPDLVLREIARVVAPGGVFAFTVPDVEHRVRVLEGVLRHVTTQTPGVMSLVRRAPKLARYADYLELSKNRFSEEGWGALGRLAGFEPVPAVAEPRQTLRMLVFRRI